MIRLGMYFDIEPKRIARIMSKKLIQPLLLAGLVFLLITSCNTSPSTENSQKEDSTTNRIDSNNTAINDSTEVSSALTDTSFVFLQDFGNNFVFEMKYATKDNFLKQAVYACPKCIIRKEVAEALVLANREFNDLGYRIKFFDCYRPLDVQKKMWDIYPNASYVANPYSKMGSMHNRGGAVDITLVNSTGEQLDMGTSFDHFGPEAHYEYRAASDKVKFNRQLLRNVMEAHGFNPIRTEWWHFSFKNSSRYPVSNNTMKCK